MGPIGLLVIQRTLQRGALVGLATGLGAAVADALYGAVGAFGVSWIIDALVGARVPLALGGGAFLLWLAWRIWHSAPADQCGAGRPGAGLLSCFAGTFVLTLSNPATIFSFIAVFGTLGARMAVSSPWTMIAGVLLGSALWWLLLSARSGGCARASTRVRRPGSTVARRCCWPASRCGSWVRCATEADPRSDQWKLMAAVFRCHSTCRPKRQQYTGTGRPALEREFACASRQPHQPTAGTPVSAGSSSPCHSASRRCMFSSIFSR